MKILGPDDRAITLDDVAGLPGDHAAPKRVCWFSAPFGGDVLNLWRALDAAARFQARHPELLVVCPWVVWALARAHASEAAALDDCRAFIRRHCDCLAAELDVEHMTSGMLVEHAEAAAKGCEIFLECP